jgi:hypothetical protein
MGNECMGCHSCGMWTPPEDDDENAVWKRNFIRRRFNFLLEILKEELDAGQTDAIIQKLGDRCAGTVLDWAQDNAGNPEGYFRRVHEKLGEDFEYDEPNGIVRINTHNKKCFCPAVNERTPGEFCNCSLGWQRRMFETVFGRPVEVRLEKALLRGDDTCIFEIRVQKEDKKED